MNAVYSFTMFIMSAKFDEETHNNLLSIMSTSLFPCMSIVTLTSKINRVHPLTMANMSAKFDEEAHSGLVSIVFTSLFPYMSIVTLNFDLQNQQGSSSCYSGQVCQVWWRCTLWFSFYCVHKVKAWRTHRHMDWQTEPQQRYYIPSATHCAGITKYLSSHKVQ